MSSYVQRVGCLPLALSMLLSLGTIIYVTILFINGIAVLSEERFLARSASTPRFAPSAANAPQLSPSRLVYRPTTTSTTRICTRLRTTRHRRKSATHKPHKRRTNSITQCVLFATLAHLAANLPHAPASPAHTLQCNYHRVRTHTGRIEPYNILVNLSSRRQSVCCN